MRIAVDIGALAAPGDGIARYLAALLGNALGRSSAGDEWLLYGRRPWSAAAASPARVRQRGDHLPAGIGRIAALASTLPAWAALDRPDVFWGPAHRLPCWLPRSTARVVTIHDLCWLRAADTMRAATRRLDAVLMPRALAAADCIVAVSHATAADLRRTFPQHAARVSVVEAAAAALPPPAPVEALAALGIRPPFVLYVGTFEPRKNLPRLLEAFARAGAPRGAQLVLCGGAGWGRLDLPAAIAALGLQSAALTLGRCDDALLATLYRHAHFLALPSRYEGFGLPLLEAMAQGTPVLTSNLASMPEVAGEAGLLVDPGSVEAIAGGIARLLDDSALHRRLAQAAQPQAARYSWSRSAEALRAVFAQARARRA
jgi:glycosyltransferase involved in cell wall biosynthesis